MNIPGYHDHERLGRCHHAAHSMNCKLLDRAVDWCRKILNLTRWPALMTS